MNKVQKSRTAFLVTLAVLFACSGIAYAFPNQSQFLVSSVVGGIGSIISQVPTTLQGALGLVYEYAVCYICNEDCYVAHNLWGGGCRPSPITGSPTCLCAESAEEAARRNLTPDSSSTCASFNAAAGEESLLTSLAFRVRYMALQCLVQADGSYDSTGCNVDCTQNHGFASGSCQTQISNVPMPIGIYLSGNDGNSVLYLFS